MHEGISEFSYLRCSSYLVILSGDFLCTFYSPSSRWWKQSWYRERKRKGETPELTAEELAALVARVELPEWFSCKKALALYFPEDTEKRFTSRCYHKTLDVEMKAGKTLEAGKSLARAMHRHAKVQWITLFPEESV